MLNIEYQKNLDSINKLLNEFKKKVINICKRTNK